MLFCGQDCPLGCTLNHKIIIIKNHLCYFSGKDCHLGCTLEQVSRYLEMAKFALRIIWTPPNLQSAIIPIFYGECNNKSRECNNESWECNNETWRVVTENHQNFSSAYSKNLVDLKVSPSPVKFSTLVEPYIGNVS